MNHQDPGFGPGFFMETQAFFGSFIRDDAAWKVLEDIEPDNKRDISPAAGHLFGPPGVAILSL
jgi:hypothetical protein